MENKVFKKGRLIKVTEIKVFSEVTHEEHTIVCGNDKDWGDFELFPVKTLDFPDKESLVREMRKFFYSCVKRWVVKDVQYQYV